MFAGFRTGRYTAAGEYPTLHLVQDVDTQILFAAAARASADTLTATLDLNELPTGAFISPLDVDRFVPTRNLNGSSTPQIEDLDGLNVLGSARCADRVDAGDLIGISYGTDSIKYGRDVSLYPTLTEYDYSSIFQNIAYVHLDPADEGGNPIIGDIHDHHT